MSELILYDFGNSVCCQKVRITLRAKQLEWRAIRVDLFKAEQYDPHYRKLNPKGVVPTLVHDGKPVIESTLICEYIDQTFPQAPRLIPADPWQQSRMRLWSKMVDDGLFEGVTEISFSAMFRERMKNMPEEIRQARFRNVGDPRRTDRFKSTYEHGVQSPFVVHAIAAYERAFKMLEDYARRERALDPRRRAEPCRYQPDAARRAARLSRAARSVDGRTPACSKLVGPCAGVAVLQVRSERSHFRGRVRGNANAWTKNPRRRRGASRHAFTERRPRPGAERRLGMTSFTLNQTGIQP